MHVFSYRHFQGLVFVVGNLKGGCVAHWRTGHHYPPNRRKVRILWSKGLYQKQPTSHLWKKIPVWIKLKSKTTQCACNCHTHNGLFLTPCCTLTHILHYPSIPHDSHLLSLGFDHSLFIALQNTPTQLTHCLVTIMTTDTNLKKITFLFTIVFHSSIAICLFVLSYCVPV